MSTRRPGRRQPTKAEQELAEEFAERAWRVVLGSAEGRHVLWRLLDLTGYHGPINLRGEDAMFALGKRSVGWAVRELVKELDADALRLIEAEGDEPPQPPPEEEDEDGGEEA